jgi:hypothetical protein
LSIKGALLLSVIQERVKAQRCQIFQFFKRHWKFGSYIIIGNYIGKRCCRSQTDRWANKTCLWNTTLQFLFHILPVIIRGASQSCLVLRTSLFFPSCEFGQCPSCTFHFTSCLQVFVWVGKDSQEEEKTQALTSGEDASLCRSLAVG